MASPRKPGPALTAADLTACRRAYEVGASFRDLAAEHDVSHSTMRLMLRAVGVVSRPVGWPQRSRQAPPAEQPQPRPAVEIVPDARGRLRIRCRTREERRLRWFTAPELQAIAVEIRAGRVQRAPKGRSGLPERPSLAERRDAEISFYRAMQRVRQAA